MDITAIINNPITVGCTTSVLLAVVRGAQGYLQKCAKDKKWVKFDLKRWLHTYFKMIPQTLFFGAFGIPIAALGSDLAFSELKKLKK